MAVMRRFEIALAFCALLVSCKRDSWGSGTYLFENGSGVAVSVITHIPCRYMEFLPNAIDTIREECSIGVNYSPTKLSWLRVYDSSDWMLLYEQNPIDESLWTVERQYKKGEYGHTVNTFVFTDDMARR